MLQQTGGIRRVDALILTRISVDTMLLAANSRDTLLALVEQRDGRDRPRLLTEPVMSDFFRSCRSVDDGLNDRARATQLGDARGGVIREQQDFQSKGFETPIRMREVCELKNMIDDAEAIRLRMRRDR
jgi:hypothetical protein